MGGTSRNSQREEEIHHCSDESDKNEGTTDGIIDELVSFRFVELAQKQARFSTTFRVRNFNTYLASSEAEVGLNEGSYEVPVTLERHRVEFARAHPLPSIPTGSVATFSIIVGAKRVFASRT